MKKWDREIHVLSLTAVPMAVASLAMAGLGAWVEHHRPISPQPGGGHALPGGGRLGRGFRPLLLAFQARVGVQLSLVSYGVPVVAAAVGTMFLDESLTLRIVLGAALVIAGAALVMRPGGKAG